MDIIGGDQGDIFVFGSNSDTVKLPPREGNELGRSGDAIMVPALDPQEQNVPPQRSATLELDPRIVGSNVEVPVLELDPQEANEPPRTVGSNVEVPMLELDPQEGNDPPRSSHITTTDGNLAYSYAANDSLSAIATLPTLEIIGSAQFGTLSDGISVLY
jgi:hypothetical protein